MTKKRPTAEDAIRNAILRTIIQKKNLKIQNLIYWKFTTKMRRKNGQADKLEVYQQIKSAEHWN